MKRCLPLIFMTVVALVSISWTEDDWLTFNDIAYNHLTSEAEANVSELWHGGMPYCCDGTSRAYIEHLNQPALHQLSVKPGLNYADFCKAITAEKADNLYTEILNCEDTLIKSKSDYIKYFALQKLVHLVGDAHQPRQIQVLNDKLPAHTVPASAYQLWEDALTEHSKTRDLERATAYDKATPKQIKLWQADSTMQWLYESYKDSCIINGYIQTRRRPGKQVLDSFRKAYRERIVQAGIRLSGMLNRIYYHTGIEYFMEQDFLPDNIVTGQDLKKLYGNRVTVSGFVVSHKTTDTATILKIKLFGDKILTVFLKGEVMKQPVEKYLTNIAVKGKLINVDGEPAMEINHLRFITQDKQMSDPL